MRRIFVSCIFWVPFFQLAEGNETEVILAELVGRMDALVADNYQGEMDFDIVRGTAESGKEIERFTGRIAWNFPNIRWDYSVSTRTGAIPDPPVEREGEKTILDTPQGLFYLIHNPDSMRTVMRCYDRSNKYDPVLRLAPWQAWIEMEGDEELAWKEIFQNADRIRDGSIEARREKLGFQVVLHASPSGSKSSALVCRFDELGRPLSYSNNGDPVSRDSSYEWKSLDGSSFPKSIRWKHSFLTSNSTGTKSVLVECTNFSTTASFSDRDFSYAALEPDKADRLVEIARGRNVVIRDSRLGAMRGSKDKVLQGLGREIQSSGFAKPK